MNWIVEQASALTSDQLSILGITGIPPAWPIQTYPYTGGDIPNGYTVMSDSDLALLVFTNQAAYDSWLASQQTAVDAAIASTTPAVGQNYLTSQYNSTNQLITETWYRDRISTGSYSTKVKQTNYTYVSNGITQVDTNYFTLSGSVYNTESVQYFTDQDNKITYTENVL